MSLGGKTSLPLMIILKREVCLRGIVRRLSRHNHGDVEIIVVQNSLWEHKQLLCKIHLALGAIHFRDAT